MTRCAQDDRKGDTTGAHVCGEARYGNVLRNALSLLPTLSVQSGKLNGAQRAPVELRNERNTAVRERSPPSSLSFRPPQPLESAQESQPAVLGFFDASTT